MSRAVLSIGSNLGDRLAHLRGVVEALGELLTVAELRGDDQLPHPADDDKLWTARMQTAWDDARAALAKGAARDAENAGAMEAALAQDSEPAAVEAGEGD